jgi:hypothetical protein
MIAISCLMPTRARHALLPRAVAGFLAQQRGDAELVIVSEDGLPESLHALIAADPLIRHVACAAGLSLGAKRNLACEAARGDWLLHWDDDDLYAPDRIARQIGAMQAAGAAVSGTSRVHFQEDDGGRCWEYRYGGERRPWVYGATLAFTRTYWQCHPFATIGIGEDNQFVWGARAAEVLDLDDPSLCLCTIHAGNTSVKHTGNAWWKSIALPVIWQQALAREGSVDRSQAGVPDGTNGANGANGSVQHATMRHAPQLSLVTEAAPVAPLRNVYACLVHEKPDCVLDLVRNLRHLDAHSAILLYDGSPDGRLAESRLPWARLGAQWVPGARPMRWGKLHDFALDCARHLKSAGYRYDAMTIVDSDQLALRAGYADHLRRRLGDLKGIGLLSSDPAPQGASTRIPPAATAQQEIELWRPFLRRFPDGERAFVHWSFWPSTVMMANAIDAMVDLFDHDAELNRILAASKLWATEEVLFPTLTRLLGFRVAANPCMQRWVKYRVPFPPGEVDAALRDPAAFWIHPVPRQLDDPIRARIRQAHGAYCTPRSMRSAAVAGPHARQLWPMLRTMRGIEGWLEDEEAELLALAAREVLEIPEPAPPRGPLIGIGADVSVAGAVISAGPPRRRTLVEVGSFCGKATYVLAAMVRASSVDANVVAIDSFDGVIGCADRPNRVAPTLDTFRRNLATHNVAALVETLVGRAADQRWTRPIDLLLIDGLHDYASVASDFHSLADHLTPQGTVLFHDCADYFPEVQDFVEALLASGEWREAARAGSMRMLRRAVAVAPAHVSDTDEPAALAG